MLTDESLDTPDYNRLFMVAFIAWLPWAIGHTPVFQDLRYTDEVRVTGVLFSQPGFVENTLAILVDIALVFFYVAILARACPWLITECPRWFYGALMLESIEEDQLALLCRLR